MLDWLRSTADVDVGQLIARKRYAKAASSLRQELRERPESVTLRLRLADVLALDDHLEEALGILERLADELAARGAYDKAIATLRKLQRLAPAWAGVDARIAALVEERDERLCGTRRAAGPPAASAAAAASSPIQLSERSPAMVVAAQKSGLFRGFSGFELDSVIGSLAERSFEPGEIVFSESEPGESLFLVVSGAVRVYVRNHSGHNSQVGILRRGDYFGELSLVEDRPREATAVAAGPCRLLELDRRRLEAIEAYYPEVPARIRQLAYRRALSPREVEARGGIESML